MPSVEDFYFAHHPFPIVSANPEVQDHYVHCRRQGTSHKMAEVFAFQTSPGLKTDTQWLAGMDFHLDENSLPGRTLIEEAKAAGVSTRGKVYSAGLARYPGDPEAWIEGISDAKRIAEKRGMSLETASGTIYKAPDTYEEPDEKPYTVAPDILESHWQDAVEDNPELASRPEAKEQLPNHSQAGINVSLVLDMPMQDDDASTVVSDVSGNGHHATIQHTTNLADFTAQNTDDYSAEGPGGALAKSLEIGPAAADEMTLIFLGDEISISGAVTIQYFAKKLDSGVVGATHAVDHDLANYAAISLDSAVSHNTTEVRFTDDGGPTEVPYSLDEEWHHYAIVLDGDMTLYVDGVLIDTATPGTPFADPILIGGFGLAFEGLGTILLAGVKVYDEARTLLQVNSDYEEGIAGSPRVPTPIRRPPEEATAQRRRTPGTLRVD